MLVFQFLPTRWGVDALIKQRLKVARLLELNDPFDLLSATTLDRKLRASFAHAVKMQNPHIGLLCFSKNWSNPVQWAHYADSHRGICLGFEVPGEKLHEVQYADFRPQVDQEALVSAFGSDKTLLDRLAFTKFIHWQYEQEVRALIALSQSDVWFEGGMYFQPMSAEINLRQLIIGARCPIGLRQWKCLAEPILKDIDVMKARPAFRTFEMVRQRNHKLWL